MRPVRIEFDEHVIALLESPSESCKVGGSESCLTLAMQDMDLRIGRSQVLGKLAGAVWAVVVDHQNIRLRDGLPQTLDRNGERFDLVISRNDGDYPHAVIPF